MNDGLDPGHVHSSGRNVGREQRNNFTLSPAFQRGFASILGHTAMHRKGGHSQRLHRGGTPLCCKAVLHEHNAALGGAENLGKILVLRFELGLHNNVLRAFRCLKFIQSFFTSDVVHHRTVHIGLDQVVNVTVEGGRIEKNLTFPGDFVEQLLDLGGESHIRHPVGLVDDDHRNLIEPAFASIDQVKEPSRGRNSHVDPPLQVGDLAAHTCTTKKRGHPSSRPTGIRDKHLSDLFRQLPSWNQDQGLGCTRVRPLDPTQNGEPVGEGLP